MWVGGNRILTAPGQWLVRAPRPGRGARPVSLCAPSPCRHPLALPQSAPCSEGGPRGDRVLVRARMPRASRAVPRPVVFPRDCANERGSARPAGSPPWDDGGCAAMKDSPARPVRPNRFFGGHLAGMRPRLPCPAHRAVPLPSARRPSHCGRRTPHAPAAGGMTRWWMLDGRRCRTAHQGSLRLRSPAGAGMGRGGPLDGLPSPSADVRAVGTFAPEPAPGRV